jgi:HTH-type transcriptional regulator/antitoxin HipB
MDIEDYKASYTQIARVTSGENYKINTLLKVLDALDLEIEIRPRQT